MWHAALTFSAPHLPALPLTLFPYDKLLAHRSTITLRFCYTRTHPQFSYKKLQGLEPLPAAKAHHVVFINTCVAGLVYICKTVSQFVEFDYGDVRWGARCLRHFCRAWMKRNQSNERDERSWWKRERRMGDEGEKQACLVTSSSPEVDMWVG
jgi:hypothetical protein